MGPEFVEVEAGAELGQGDSCQLAVHREPRGVGKPGNVGGHTLAVALEDGLKVGDRILLRQREEDEVDGLGRTAEELISGREISAVASTTKGGRPRAAGPRG